MAHHHDPSSEGLRDFLRSLRSGETGARPLRIDELVVTAQAGGWVCVAPRASGSPLEAALALMQTQIAQKAVHGAVQVGIDRHDRLCLLSRFIDEAASDALQLQDSLKRPLALLASLGGPR